MLKHIYILSLLLTATISFTALASNNELRISHPLTTGQRISDVQLTPNGVYAVYLLNDLDDIGGLYITVTKNGRPRRLNDDLRPGGKLGRKFWITPDGQYVIYFAQLLGGPENGLYITNIDGTNTQLIDDRFFESIDSSSFNLQARDFSFGDNDSPYFYYHVKLSANESENGFYRVDYAAETASEQFVQANLSSSVESVVAPDENNIVFRAKIIADEAEAIFSTSIPSQSDPVLLLDNLGSSSGTDFSTTIKFKISPDSKYVVISKRREGQFNTCSCDVFSMSIDGGPINRLNQGLGSFRSGFSDDFLITPDLQKVIFISGFSATTDGIPNLDLYSAPIAGGNASKLNIDTDNNQVSRFEIINNGDTVVFTDEELYSVNLNDSNVTQLSRTGVSAELLAISPDDKRAIYRLKDSSRKLYSASIKTGARQLFLPSSFEGFVSSLRYSPTGERVLFVNNLTSEDGMIRTANLYSIPSTGRVAPSFVIDPRSIAFDASLSDYSITSDGNTVVVLSALGGESEELFSFNISLFPGLPPKQNCFPIVSNKNKTKGVITTVCL